nr:wax ester/triacylglycerol synthase family O-acyltransferase [Nocardia sp. CNY236]
MHLRPFDPGRTESPAPIDTAPLNLPMPIWESDPHFDLSHHMRRIALPEPGDELELCESVATELAERLAPAPSATRDCFHRRLPTPRRRCATISPKMPPDSGSSIAT